MTIGERQKNIEYLWHSHRNKGDTDRNQRLNVFLHVCHFHITTVFTLKQCNPLACDTLSWSFAIKIHRFCIDFQSNRMQNVEINTMTYFVINHFRSLWFDKLTFKNTNEISDKLLWLIWFLSRFKVAVECIKMLKRSDEKTVYNYEIHCRPVVVLRLWYEQDWFFWIVQQHIVDQTIIITQTQTHRMKRSVYGVCFAGSSAVCMCECDDVCVCLFCCGSKSLSFVHRMSDSGQNRRQLPICRQHHHRWTTTPDDNRNIPVFIINKKRWANFFVVSSNSFFFLLLPLCTCISHVLASWIVNRSFEYMGCAR